MMAEAPLDAHQASPMGEGAPISGRGRAEAVSRGAAGAGVVWRRDGLFTSLVLAVV
jgi:hypothetical protein